MIIETTLQQDFQDNGPASQRPQVGVLPGIASASSIASPARCQQLYSQLNPQNKSITQAACIATFVQGAAGVPAGSRP
jgi:hypothetical protein